MYRGNRGYPANYGGANYEQPRGAPYGGYDQRHPGNSPSPRNYRGADPGFKRRRDEYERHDYRSPRQVSGPPRGTPSPRDYHRPQYRGGDRGGGNRGQERDRGRRQSGGYRGPNTKVKVDFPSASKEDVEKFLKESELDLVTPAKELPRRVIDKFVGISAWSTPDHPGFTAAMKDRTTDFLVDEIDKNGTVASLQENMLDRDEFIASLKEIVGQGDSEAFVQFMNKQEGLTKELKDKQEAGRDMRKILREGESNAKTLRDSLHEQQKKRHTLEKERNDLETAVERFYRRLLEKYPKTEEKFTDDAGKEKTLEARAKIRKQWQDEDDIKELVKNKWMEMEAAREELRAVWQANNEEYTTATEGTVEEKEEEFKGVSKKQEKEKLDESIDKTVTSVSATEENIKTCDEANKQQKQNLHDLYDVIAGVQKQLSRSASYCFADCVDKDVIQKLLKLLPKAHNHLVAELAEKPEEKKEEKKEEKEEEKEEESKDEEMKDEGEVEVKKEETEDKEKEDVKEEDKEDKEDKENKEDKEDKDKEVKEDKEDKEDKKAEESKPEKDNRLYVTCWYGLSPRRRINYELHDDEYVKFVMQKQHRDTNTVIGVLTSQLNLAKTDLVTSSVYDGGVGITSQFVCGRRADIKGEVLLNSVQRMKGYRGIKVGNFETIDSPLELGQVYGNQFSMILRNLEAKKPAETDDDKEVVKTEEETDTICTEEEVVKTEEETCQAAVDMIQAVAGAGFINYYGLDEFGKGCVPTHFIGKSLLKGDFKTAVAYLLMERTSEAKDVRVAKQYFEQTRDIKGALARIPIKQDCEIRILKGLDDHGPNAFSEALSNLPPLIRRMFARSYQCYVWNSMASVRMTEFDRSNPVVGDLVIDNSESMEEEDKGEDKEEDEGEDKEKEEKKAEKKVRVKMLTEEDISSGNYSLTDIVLPIPSINATYPSNLLDRYTTFLSDEGIDVNSLQNEVVEELSEEYRPLVSAPEKVHCEILEDNSSVTVCPAYKRFQTDNKKKTKPHCRHGDKCRYFHPKNEKQDWICSSCKGVNYPKRTECYKCKAPKPAPTEEATEKQNTPKTNESKCVKMTFTLKAQASLAQFIREVMKKVTPEEKEEKKEIKEEKKEEKKEGEETKEEEKPEAMEEATEEATEAVKEEATVAVQEEATEETTEAVENGTEAAEKEAEDSQMKDE